MKVIMLIDSDKSFVEIAGDKIINHIFRNLIRIASTKEFEKYGIKSLDIMACISGDYTTVLRYLKDKWQYNNYSPRIDSIESSSYAIYNADKSRFFEDNKFFWLIKADFYLPSEQWDNVFKQYVLHYPVFFVVPRRTPRNTVIIDNRDGCLKSINRKSIMYIESGIYKLSSSMIKYTEDRSEITDTIIDYIKEEKLKWGVRQIKKLPTTIVFTYPLNGWIPVEDM